MSPARSAQRCASTVAWLSLVQFDSLIASDIARFGSGDGHLGLLEVLVAFTDETIDQFDGDQLEAPPTGDRQPFVIGQLSADASHPFGFRPEHGENHLGIPGVVAAAPFTAIEPPLEGTRLSGEFLQPITGPAEKVTDTEEVFHRRGGVHPGPLLKIGRVIGAFDDPPEALRQGAERLRLIGRRFDEGHRCLLSPAKPGPQPAAPGGVRSG
jgi:hypothetical protein